MVYGVDEDVNLMIHKRHPDAPTEADSNLSDEVGGPLADDDAMDEMDPRAAEVQLVPQYVDLPDQDLRAIMALALAAYNTHVLVPTRNTWRKDEGTRRELEREVERTAVSDMTRDIKRSIDAKLGGCWHVVYGRDFGTHVSHQSQSFCHFQLEGANVVVWRHGM